MFRIQKWFLIFVLLFSPGIVYGFVGCDEDCMKCHTLNTEEVQGILGKLNKPDARILKVQMSPVRGLWEIAIEEKGGQRGLFYLDFSRKYLIAGPIVEVNAALNKTRERVAELNKNRKVNRSRIPLKNALLLGDKKAPKKIIVFTDPDCPFCGKLHSELKKVAEQRKDIAFYIKLFPLKMHPDAYWKSKSIACNKSLELLEDNFEKKSIPRPDCETKEIDENIKLAGNIGITGTPTMIMPDGSVHSGLLEADKIIQIIDSKNRRSAGAEKKE